MPRMFRSDKDRHVWEMLSATIELQAWIHNHVPAKDLPLDLLDRHMANIARVSEDFDHDDMYTHGERGNG